MLSARGTPQIIPLNIDNAFGREQEIFLFAHSPKQQILLKIVSGLHQEIASSQKLSIESRSAEKTIKVGERTRKDGGGGRKSENSLRERLRLRVIKTLAQTSGTYNYVFSC